MMSAPLGRSRTCTGCSMELLASEHSVTAPLVSTETVKVAGSAVNVPGTVHEALTGVTASTASGGTVMVAKGAPS